MLPVLTILQQQVRSSASVKLDFLALIATASLA
jgi:hypothetical protein